MRSIITFCLIVATSSIIAAPPEPDNTLFGAVETQGQQPTMDVSGLVVEAKALNPDDSPGATVASYALGSHPEAGPTDFAVKVKVDNGTPERPNALARGDQFALFVEGQQVSDIFTAGGADSFATLFRRVDLDLEPGFDFFRWGDIACPQDGIVGNQDAFFILQFVVDNPVDFSCVNDQIQPGKFLPAGDVNGDGVMGVLDTSLILRKGTGLIDFFPADANKSTFGPDLTDPQPFSKSNNLKIEAGGSIELAQVTPDASGKATMPLTITNGDGVSGWHITVTWDASSLSLDQFKSSYPSATNTSTPGELRIASASTEPLAGELDLGDLVFTPTPSASGPTPVTIRLNGSSLNDGQLAINSATNGLVLLPETTKVPDWVRY